MYNSDLCHAMRGQALISPDCMDLPAPVRLTYSIHACSSYSGQYSPQNILVDDPNDQKSRWSGGGIASANNGAGRDTAAAAAQTLSTSVLTPSLGGPAQSSNVAPSNPGSVLAGSTLKERQWLLLKLANRSILRSITFGKFSRAHPCNVREFKVYGGLSPDMKTMSLVYWGGLKNDSTAEEVEVAWRNPQGVIIPVEYVCVEPLSAHSSNYNISIWHIALAGNADEDLVASVLSTYQQYRQRQANRLILKHLRQSGELAAFEALKASLITKDPHMRLEHPLLSRFHELLVQQGDFVQAEQLLQGMLDPATDCDDLHNLFEKDEAPGSAPIAIWECIDDGLDFSGPGGHKPSARGGHSLVVVSHTGNAHDASQDDIGSTLIQSSLYLFGGWNGTDELSDFWRFSLSTRRWHLISNVRSVAADEPSRAHPQARSCHQMAVDATRGKIYLLGRFVDPPSTIGLGVAVQDSTGAHSNDALLNRIDEAAQVSTEAVPLLPAGLHPADFWVYDTNNGDSSGWVQLSIDVRQEGGPALIFDHQMQIDPLSRILYVFGGKYHDLQTKAARYSGLYAYNLDRGTWRCLIPDSNFEPARHVAKQSEPNTICSRIGHSMLFDQRARALLIFGGQYGNTYLEDFWIYNVDTGGVEKRMLKSNAKGPEGGFTQRAAFDPVRREFMLLSGLSRDRNPPYRTQWRHIETDVVQEEFGAAEAGNNVGKPEPKPRFAHQFVYDEASDVHYLFGGNPADSFASTRLGDFWSLRLARPSKAEMLRRSRFLLRRCRFMEICREHGSMEALVYLQSEVAPVTSAAEQTAFLACTSELLSNGVPSRTSEEDDERMITSQCLSSETAQSRITSLVAEGHWAERTAVFTEVSRLFSPLQTEPIEDLLSMATAWEGVLC